MHSVIYLFGEQKDSMKFYKSNPFVKGYANQIWNVLTLYYNWEGRWI